MFYDPVKREVLDYVGGRADLKKRVVRTIGRAADRFGEDHLRMLRAVRFSTQLGFAIERGDMGGDTGPCRGDIEDKRREDCD